MGQADIIEILQLSISTVLYAALPVIAGALAIGFTIAIFQALTSIQEMTLTFVPKIIGILIILMLSFPYMFGRLKILSDVIFDAMVQSPL